MKLKFSQVAIACMYAGMLLLDPRAAAAEGTKPADDKRGKLEDKPTTAKATKLMSTRNNDAVRIFPDVIRRTMHVVAKDNDGKQIDFFVFDLEGTIIHHFKMKSRDHERLEDLKRGKYVYRVFSGDEETAAGEIEIR